MNKSVWDGVCARVLPGLRQRLYWEYILGKVSRGDTDSWAYRFQLTQWVEQGLAIFRGRI